MNTPAPIITLKPLYLDRESAAAYLSISSSLLEKLVAKGAAPKPRKLSANRCAWLVEDLEQWGRERPVSDLLPARGSGYGRAGAPADASEESRSLGYAHWPERTKSSSSPLRRV